MGTYILASSLWLYREHGFSFPYWQMASASAYFMVAGASVWQSVQRAVLIARRKEKSLLSRIFPN